MKPVTAPHPRDPRYTIHPEYTGEPVYLDPQQAIVTAQALAECASTARRDQLRKTANRQRSISHGTMRPADLVPAFLAELAKHDSDTAASYQREIPPAALTDDRAAFWDTEDAADILNSLFDALDSAAPDGCYFGAHPGDGSDYGFWMTEEAADELEELESETAGYIAELELQEAQRQPQEPQK